MWIAVMALALLLPLFGRAASAISKIRYIPPTTIVAFRRRRDEGVRPSAVVGESFYVAAQVIQQINVGHSDASTQTAVE